MRSRVEKIACEAASRLLVLPPRHYARDRTRAMIVSMLTVSAPGLFGKIPTRGDFLSRRVPACIRAEWEQWLADLTMAVRKASGESFDEVWFAAPVWRFRLGAAMVPPHGAAGVLIPSSDRVGRPFPFTIIGAASETMVEDWMARAEALLLRALREDGDPDMLDAELTRLGPPAVPSQDEQPCRPAANQSLWYSHGSPLVSALYFRCPGLPNRGMAVGMVTGRFDLDGAEFGRYVTKDSEDSPSESEHQCHQDQGSCPDDR
jgi:type VI secretion system protein ImpM